MFTCAVSPSSSGHNLTWKGLAHVITGKCLKNFNIFSAFGNMIYSMAQFLFLKVIICLTHKEFAWRLMENWLQGATWPPKSLIRKEITRSSNNETVYLHKTVEIFIFCSEKTRNFNIRAVSYSLNIQSDIVQNC